MHGYYGEIEQIFTCLPMNFSPSISKVGKFSKDVIKNILLLAYSEVVWVRVIP